MKVLLDECLPRKLKFELEGHEVYTVPQQGWAGITNGRLLRLAEGEFEVFVTVDQNMSYQQNLQSLVLGIIVLVAPSNQLETLKALVPQILTALQTIKAGDVLYIGDA